MRRGAIILTTIALLVGLLVATRPATGQEPFPTPRGRLGGREPLVVTPVLPSPPATVGPTPAGSGTPSPRPTVPAFGTPTSEATGRDNFASATSAEAAARVLPAVVVVVASGRSANVGTPTTDPLAVGSGVIVDDAGHVITAADVVAGAASVDVVLGGGERRAAILVGSDDVTGLAVLRVDGALPAPAMLGDASALRPGQAVIAVGVPFGELPAVVTEGVVGTARRSAPAGSVATSVVWHDAAVPPGGGGGPLVTQDGAVVGINLVIGSGDPALLPRDAAPVRPGHGILEPLPDLSYAVPGETARRVLEAMVAEGRVRYPFLGAVVRPSTPAASIELGLAVAIGAAVVEVEAVGPGDLGGLRIGDVILALAGQRIDGGRPFGDALLAHQVGDQVAIVVRRGATEVELTVVLGERPRDGAPRRR